MSGNHRTGLLVMDLQRDFCEPSGVFPRNGFPTDAVRAIVPRVARVMGACREAGIPSVATALTVLVDPEGKAMGLGHLTALRPFMVTEGFREGTPGHEMIPELPKPDYVVRKWGYSAMHMTELEKHLRSLRLTRLVFTGISTNGVVEGTARDAVARDFEVVTLRDCVAGYDNRLHEASLLNLANIGTVISSDEFLAEIASTPQPA